jgi:hypothetical protein
MTATLTGRGDIDFPDTIDDIIDYRGWLCYYESGDSFIKVQGGFNEPYHLCGSAMQYFFFFSQRSDA